MASRKISQRERIVGELAAIRKIQQNPPSFFRKHDHDRLASEWQKKTAELVDLEIAAYRRRLGG